MAVERISKRSVDALPVSTKRTTTGKRPGEPTDDYIWDTEVPGFALKVTPQGVRTYLLQYRAGGRGTPTRRYTIGRHGVWTPDEARAQARKLKQLVDQGIDPQREEQERRAAAREEQRKAHELNFETFLERFLEEYGKANWRDATYKSAESNLRRYALPILKGKALPDISRAEARAVRDSVPATRPGLRRSVFAHTRKLFAWAVSEGHIERSPFEGLTNPQAAASRERVLTDEELRLVWLGSQQLANPFGQMVRLLMLTGQRRDEVAGMDWAELDRKAALWTIPGKRTKNGETQLVPLTAAAIAELDTLAGGKSWPRKGYACSTNGGKSSISGFSKAKARLDGLMLAVARKEDAEAELEPWRLHDLRRTLATGMQRLGVRFEVTEAILNHTSGAKAGVAGVYQRHDWRDEKQAALEAWAKHLGALL